LILIFSGPLKNRTKDRSLRQLLQGSRSQVGFWPNQSSNLITLTIAPHPAWSEYFPVGYGSPT
jgi:hypothetical protein